MTEELLTFVGEWERANLVVRLARFFIYIHVYIIYNNNNNNNNNNFIDNGGQKAYLSHNTKQS